MIRPARHATAPAVAVALAITMTGCASTEAKPAEWIPPSPTPLTIVVPPEPPYRTLSTQELATVLLDVGDLPANYIPAPSAGWLHRRFCADRPPHAPTAPAAATHIRDGGPPDAVIRTAIWQFATTEQATASFDAVTAAMRDCRQETTDGRSYRYAPAQLTAGHTYRMTAVRVTADGTATLQGFAVSGPALVTVEIGELTPAGQTVSGMTGAAHDADRLQQLISKQIIAYRTAAREHA